MPLRSAALLLLFAAHALAQSPAPIPWAAQQKTFKETDFNVTYSYPQDFVPDDKSSTAPDSYTLPPAKKYPDAPCVEAPLSVGYTNHDGNSVLVFSIIGDACANVLTDASNLERFTETQILRQLQRYGVPSLTHPATRFTVDGRPAAIATASAHAVETQQGDTLTVTYAAKVCFYSDEPSITRLAHVICIDFTTQQPNLLPPMLAFPIQFGANQPHPLVPAKTLR